MSEETGYPIEDIRQVVGNTWSPIARQKAALSRKRKGKGTEKKPVFKPFISQQQRASAKKNLRKALLAQKDLKPRRGEEGMSKRQIQRERNIDVRDMKRLVKQIDQEKAAKRKTRSKK